MKAELLSPAGSYEGLRAVIKAGADAVYIGGSLFGARAYAKNPREEEMLEAIDYAHIHGKKIYLTVNTLLKNQEIYGQLYDFLAPYYQRGADAVIVQDLGVLSFLKKEFPGMAIHASTQMAVTGEAGARLIQEAGADRVVTARELSLGEIRRIYEETGVELESFVHGALCYSYSGMCLFSSLLGGRSGNRGRCAQPCRLPYMAYDRGKALNNRGQAYLLSPKDMCTIEILPELLEAGVYSLKIEGRMKRAEYAAGVTSIYRKYLDLYEKNPAGYNVSKKDWQTLFDLYQRDGFNQGYYHTQNGSQMMAVVNEKEQRKKDKKAEKSGENRNEELFSDLKARFLDTKKKEKIYGNLILFADSPAILDLEFRDTQVQVSGRSVERAKNQPLSAERAKKQMEKTGDTPFVFESLEVVTDEAGFLPMQSLNELRREGLARLEEEYLRQFFRRLPQKKAKKEAPEEIRKPGSREKRALFVSAETREQLVAVLQAEAVQGVYCSLSMFGQGEGFLQTLTETAQTLHGRGKAFYLSLPYVLRKGQLDSKKSIFQELAKKGEIDGFLARNLEELGFLKEAGILAKAVCDSSLYSFNDEAQSFLEHLGVLRTTVPFELNEKEIRRKDNRNSELVLYGYYPMMISAQCIRKTCGRCEHKPGVTELKDRYGQRFLVQNCCDFCYNIIYNSVPTSLLREREAIRAIEEKGIAGFRLSFTLENGEETRRLLDTYSAVFEAAEKKKEKENRKSEGDEKAYTKGHFRRGVE